MCFDLDSRPPIVPIAGGALESARVVLTADDGNRLAGFRAWAAEPSGTRMLVLPDVRGLHPFYEELTLRLAEHGVDALAIDYFGRTAALDAPRDESFDYRTHVEQTTWDGLATDARAGVAALREPDGRPDGGLFTMGFCFGGRLAFLTTTLGLPIVGAVGFYGVPVGPPRVGMPAPAEVAGSMRGAILGLYGGADPAIPAEDVETFERALSAAGVDHRLVSYPGAPHSFFDRKAADFADASAAAWAEVLDFVRRGAAIP